MIEKLRIVLINYSPAAACLFPILHSPLPTPTLGKWDIEPVCDGEKVPSSRDSAVGSGERGELGESGRVSVPLSRRHCPTLFTPTTGSLNLLVRSRNKGALDTHAWSLSGNKGNVWQQVHVPINPSGPFQVSLPGPAAPHRLSQLLGGGSGQEVLGKAQCLFPAGCEMGELPGALRGEVCLAEPPQRLLPAF